MMLSLMPSSSSPLGDEPPFVPCVSISFVPAYLCASLINAVLDAGAVVERLPIRFVAKLSELRNSALHATILASPLANEQLCFGAWVHLNA